MVFICCERPVISLSSRDFFHHPYVVSFFLSIFYMFHLYTFLSNYYSLLHTLHLKFPFYPFFQVFPFRKNHPFSEGKKFRLSLCMSLVLCASRNVSFNDDNHILKFFTEGFTVKFFF